MAGAIHFGVLYKADIYMYIYIYLEIGIDIDKDIDSDYKDFRQLQRGFWG